MPYLWREQICRVTTPFRLSGLFFSTKAEPSLALPVFFIPHGIGELFEITPRTMMQSPFRVAQDGASTLVQSAQIAHLREGFPARGDGQRAPGMKRTALGLVGRVGDGTGNAV